MSKSIKEGELQRVEGTENYVLNQTMLRIRDPQASLEFYCNVLGMSLIRKLDFEEMQFSLYFLGYLREADGPVPSGDQARTVYTFKQKGLLELTHNWGTESDPSFAGYHSGNEDPRGFGHIGISVPDVSAASQRFEEANIEFVKRPNEGSMRDLAFIRDPDGYWVEILNPESLSEICK